MPTLVFIDTNILLDFYRIRGPTEHLAILKHIDAHHDRIITTSQVEMEFKKNRAGAILESYRGLKSSSKGDFTLPSYLATSKQASGVETSRRRIDKHVKTLRTRVRNVLSKPTTHDPVYRVVQRLFRVDSPLNLSRTKDARFSIRRLAFKRFLLGYPPRKPTDLSMGDAVNWEWIIRCAGEENADVVVVSRDSDYGIVFGDSSYINDWLLQEFRDRVSKRRSVRLTTRLAEGLKVAGIRVTKKQQEAEEKFLRSAFDAVAANAAARQASVAPVQASIIAATNVLLPRSRPTFSTALFEAIERLQQTEVDTADSDEGDA